MSWSTPEATTIRGQICFPCVLHGDVVVAACNHREPPRQGIQLWFSQDRGHSWDALAPVQMWDTEVRGSPQPLACLAWPGLA